MIIPGLCMNWYFQKCMIFVMQISSDNIFKSCRYDNLSLGVDALYRRDVEFKNVPARRSSNQSNTCTLSILKQELCQNSAPLWHNSLITISIFCDFWKQTICECYNFREIDLDENIPVWLKSILCTGNVEFWDKTLSLTCFYEKAC